MIGELISRYDFIFPDCRPFFCNPVSLLFNYPGSRWYVQGDWVIVEDAIGRYGGFFLGEGRIEGLPEGVSFANALCLSQLNEGLGRLRLVDAEFVYEVGPLLRRIDRKRRAIIREGKGLFVVRRGRGVDCADVLAVVGDWARAKAGQGEAELTATSMREVVEAFMENRSIIEEFYDVVEIGLFRNGRLVGWGSALAERGGAWAWQVFEFCRADWRRFSAFLFYCVVQEVLTRGARWLNTLGCNMLDSLMYNKNLYGPRFLIPQYRLELGV